LLLGPDLGPIRLRAALKTLRQKTGPYISGVVTELNGVPRVSS